MNDFRAAGMAGHLRVGPQYIAPNPNGALVIQRGPHGASLAKRPPYVPGQGFQWWGEQVVGTAPWLPRQKVVGVMGLGDGSKPEASYKVQANMEREAKRLADASVSPPASMVNVLISQVDATLISLNSFRPWSEGTFWGQSSQKIRANLQIARQNLIRRLEGSTAPPKQPMQRDLDIVDTFDKRDVAIQAQEMGKKVNKFFGAVSDTAGDIVDSPKRPAAVVLGLGLLGIGVYAFAKGKASGPTIRIG
jgi:hypothetical protein